MFLLLQRFLYNQLVRLPCLVHQLAPYYPLDLYYPLGPGHYLPVRLHRLDPYYRLFLLDQLHRLRLDPMDRCLPWFQLNRLLQLRLDRSHLAVRLIRYLLQYLQGLYYPSIPSDPWVRSHRSVRSTLLVLDVPLVLGLCFRDLLDRFQTDRLDQ